MVALAIGGHTALLEEAVGETRNPGQFAELGLGIGLLAVRNRKAMAGIVDGAFEQACKWQTTAPGCLAVVIGQPPPGQGAGDRIGGQRTAPGNARHAGIQVRRHASPGCATGIDRTHGLARRMQQPEAIAADAGHVRIDHGQCRGNGNRRFDGVTALAQDIEAGLCCQRMRGDDGATGSEYRFHQSVSLRVSVCCRRARPDRPMPAPPASWRCGRTSGASAFRDRR